MGDYKYAAQVRAEELAEDQGVDFFTLSQDEQCKLYNQGLKDVFEDMLSTADKD